MTKRRIINIRVTCVVFIGLMLGILFCRAYSLNQLTVAGIWLIIISLILVCGGVILYAWLTRKYNMQCRARKNVSTLLIISSIGFALAFLFGIFLTTFPYLKILTLPNFSDEVTVYGQVCDYVDNSGTYTKFLIEDVVIEDNEGINKCSFKVCIYTTKTSRVSLGSNIEFTGELDKYKLSNSFDNIKLYQNIGYDCYVDIADINILSENHSLKDIIKNSTKNMLVENLNNDNASIFYAVLFGDKIGLDGDISDMFSYSGISHILAVSGLHISVIVSILYFFMKKCKLNKYVQLILLSVILIFYSYLCSFTPSVSRATIMAILLCLCDVLKIEYDSLSSLSIAGIIILTLSPVSLFNVSFQLSFLCLFSIISIAPTINKFLCKIKCPQILATSLGMSIATNLAILPVCLNVFSKVSLLGVIANIFILPLFSIAYVLLFVIVFLSLIFRFLTFLLFVPNLFLHVIKVIANYIASIPFGIFKAFNVSYWSLVLLIGGAISMHFLLTRNLIKSTISIMLFGMVLIIFVTSSIPKSYTGSNFIFVSKYKSNACYYVKDNEVTLVGTSANSNVIQTEMKRLRLKKITNVYAYDLSLNKLDDFVSICKEYNVENVYLPSSLNYDELKSKFKNVIFFDNKIEINQVEIYPIYFENTITAIYLDGGEFNRILIPEIKPTQDEGESISKNCISWEVDVVYISKSCTTLDYAKIRPKIKIVNDDYVYYKNNSQEEFDIYVYN